MGKLAAKIDYESLRKSRILENKTRLAALGLQKTISDLRSISSSAKQEKRKWQKKVYAFTGLRRSSRLQGIKLNADSTVKISSLRSSNSRLRAKTGEQKMQMGKLAAKIDYENLRKSRILENQVRLASLGLQKTISDLRSISSSAKQGKRKWQKKVYAFTGLRRSSRLKGIKLNADSTVKTPSLRSSNRLRTKTGENEESAPDGEQEEKRPANAPLVKVKGSQIERSPELLQKKLCGEEDCKRCSNLDVNEPCIGKTDCSVCHSSNGLFCRACLKVRYGEELEQVRENKEWMCPHCIEEEGIRPYWICNSSLCLKKRKIAPTGIAIFRARELGYESVAHLLMDQLQRRTECSK